MGFQDVRPLTWGEHTRVGSLAVVALPVRHFAGRSLHETRSVPQSYIIQGDKTVYFGGDSGLTGEFAKIGGAYPIDLAFLPIGHYHPSSFRKGHMSPEDALQAMEMLRAKRVVAIHWGAFRLSLETMEEPPRRFLRLLKEKGANPKAVVLQPGERIRI